MNNMRNLCCNIALQCWKLDVKILIPGSWIIVCIGNWKFYCTVVHCKFFRTFNAKKNIETGARSLELLGWDQIMSTWLLWPSEESNQPFIKKCKSSTLMVSPSMTPHLADVIDWLNVIFCLKIFRWRAAWELPGLLTWPLSACRSGQPRRGSASGESLN